MEIESKQPSVSYVPFPDLVNSAKGKFLPDIRTALEKAFASDHWVAAFEGICVFLIILLRQQNKIHTDTFLGQLFPSFIRQVEDQIQSLRSNNSKHALMLATQIFHLHTLTDAHQPLLQGLLHKIIAKACSEKKFIKDQARQALKALGRHNNPSWILALFIQQMFSQSVPIAELAAHTFCEVSKSLSVLNWDSNIQSILRSVPQLSMRGKAITRPLKEGLELVIGKVGNDKVEGYIGELDGIRGNQIRQFIYDKKQVKKVELSLREMIKEKRKKQNE